MTQLRTLGFAENTVSDLTLARLVRLVGRWRPVSGKHNNLLEGGECSDIDTLRNRGVIVTVNLFCS